MQQAWSLLPCLLFEILSCGSLDDDEPHDRITLKETEEAPKITTAAAPICMYFRGRRRSTIAAVSKWRLCYTAEFILSAYFFFVTFDKLRQLFRC